MENEKFLNQVYKLYKALYSLNEALSAWYERLSGFLLENGCSMGKADTIFFIKHKNEDIFIVQNYIDDIVLVLLMRVCVRNFHVI